MAIAKSTGLVALDCGDGDYYVIQLLGHEVELGDRMVGEMHVNGGHVLFNETRRERIHMYGQASHATKAFALGMLCKR